MPNTKNDFQFGDILLVPFPFTDQTKVKQRPAVVVSSSAYHRDQLDLILLAVTSQVRPGNKVGDAAVTKWKEAGLIKPSVLKPLLTTIDRGLIKRKLGSLVEQDREALRTVLSEIVGE